jgi:hypothetical protein
VNRFPDAIPPDQEKFNETAQETDEACILTYGRGLDKARSAELRPSGSMRELL